MIGIIADDLTGSGDAGIHFADRGLDTVIQVEQDGVNAIKYASCDVFIINTGTRFAEPAAAYEQVRKACVILKALHAERIFKKIDSTLRGNLCAEADALFDEFGLKTLPFCAAFPSMGRTTVKGIHYVGGKPINQTEFADDPRNPVKEASIKALFESGTANAGSIRICNAEKDGDIADFADRIVSAGCRVAAGSGALAKELAEAWSGPLAGDSNMRRGEIDPGPHPVLVVSATKSSVTAKQLEELQKLHEVISVPINFGEGKAKISDWDGSEAGRSMAIFAAPESKAVSPVNVLNVLERLAAKLCENGRFADLVLAGGDTAAAICHALNIKVLKLIRSVLPGIAYCRDYEGIYGLILKPGSFGTRDTLVKCYRFLNEREIREY